MNTRRPGPGWGGRKRAGQVRVSRTHAQRYALGFVTFSSLWRRYRSSLREFITFGLIGGSGVLVNMAVFALANNIAIHAFGSNEYDRFLSFPGTDWSIRNYLVYAMVAFLAANLYNFVLNRYITFRGDHRAPFIKEYVPFLIVGSVAQLAALVMLQLLLNRNSPIYLGADLFVDGSPFWRRRAYWANLMAIIVVMPVNFVANKLWTFRAVRRLHARSTP
ncbi:MAG: GtrA family protein [Propioniciclava sp.]